MRLSSGVADIVFTDFFHERGALQAQLIGCLGDIARRNFQRLENKIDLVVLDLGLEIDGLVMQ